MSRIGATIKARQSQGQKALIPYLVAGDPNLPTTAQLMHALVAAGADIIELGFPFSDPSADGPVIQKGAERSLAAGTTLRDVLELVSQFRQSNADTPVVLMGYLNPIEIMGYERFVNEASTAGVDGVLIVDMPPVESGQMIKLLRQQQMDAIFLVAPTTSAARAELISKQCSGYLYYVSLKGVTGAAITDTESIRRNVRNLKKLSDLPVVIGFGIKDEKSAASMAELADGVVIGSALVERIAELENKSQHSDADIAATVSLFATVRKILDNFN
ncbi:MAG: tryptophan synthase subunit alpha [Gammaproteobacteria bacterium]|nr:tryptophan synthase subunit alpha [Gammaproteobacteria bacterium]